MNLGNLQVEKKAREDVIQDLLLAARCRDGRSCYGCFCEAHLFVQSQRRPEVRSALEAASFVYPDGISLVLGAKLAGYGRIQRHPGPAVFGDLCEAGVQTGLRHYFYGGVEGVAEQLSKILENRFPGIEIAGYESPPFRELTKAEETAFLERLRAAKPDILWVGLGAPKQELWMERHAEQLKVPLMLGVGAAFDYWTGRQKWAPAWMRHNGLEWLYRMATGGRRLFKRYLTYVPLCCYYLIRCSISSRLCKRALPANETLRSKDQ